MIMSYNRDKNSKYNSRLCSNHRYDSIDKRGIRISEKCQVAMNADRL